MMKRRFVMLCCSVSLGGIITTAHAGPIGTCNSILGRNLGSVQQIENGVVGQAACVDLGAGLADFIENDCFARFDNGELFVKAGDQDKPLGSAICDALIDTCGFDPFLPDNICPEE